jgi:hypothetical protein
MKVHRREERKTGDSTKRVRAIGEAQRLAIEDLI